MTLIFIDCEAPFGKGSPAVADMTEFGAVCYDCDAEFHGLNCSQQTFGAFGLWLAQHKHDVTRLTMVSDNPAYDWQWINFYFWKYFNENPLGHSARRIGDFYAGLRGNFKRQSDWKNLRVTPHDHNPVNDARGNLEAFREMVRGTSE